MNNSRFFKALTVILILLHCITAIETHSQNLVCNPSFEDTVSLYPIYPLDRLSQAKCWKRTGTPDYFWYGNKGGVKRAVKENWAHSGECVVRMIHVHELPNSAQDALIGTLNEPLVSGATYELSAFALFQKNALSEVDAIDLLLLKTPEIPNIQEGLDPIRITRGETLSDGWVRFSVEFTAETSSVHFALGHFTRPVAYTREFSKRQLTKRRSQKICDYLLDDIQIAPLTGHLLSDSLVLLDKDPLPIELTDECGVDSISERHLINFFFNSGEYRLKDDHFNRLDRLAEALKTDINATVILVGHADARGAEVDNLKLSRQRIDAVISGLVSRGISLDQIESISRGESQLGDQSPSLRRRVAAYIEQ